MSLDLDTTVKLAIYTTIATLGVWPSSRCSVRGGIANFLWPALRGLFKALAVGVISWILATLAVFLLMKRRSLCT